MHKATSRTQKSRRTARKTAPRTTPERALDAYSAPPPPVLWLPQRCHCRRHCRRRRRCRLCLQCRSRPHTPRCCRCCAALDCPFST
eukprot:6196072-Pleurochrysis_carterae.AAC.2